MDDENITYIGVEGKSAFKRLHSSDGNEFFDEYLS